METVLTHFQHIFIIQSQVFFADLFKHQQLQSLAVFIIGALF